MKGDTTITLKGENTITITETAYTAALDMYSANLTIQGSGSLTVNEMCIRDSLRLKQSRLHFS